MEFFFFCPFPPLPLYPRPCCVFSLKKWNSTSRKSALLWGYLCSIKGGGLIQTRGDKSCGVNSLKNVTVTPRCSSRGLHPPSHHSLTHMQRLLGDTDCFNKSMTRPFRRCVCECACPPRARAKRYNPKVILVECVLIRSRRNLFSSLDKGSLTRGVGE